MHLKKTKASYGNQKMVYFQLNFNKKKFLTKNEILRALFDIFSSQNCDSGHDVSA